MCQETDSSRQKRGELGLCSRGTRGEEATHSHSSIWALIREVMGKQVNAGEGNDPLPEAQRMSASQDTICIFKKGSCVGCDLIQLPPPDPSSPQFLVPLHLSWIHHCPSLYGNKRARQQFLLSLLLMAPWLWPKSTFKLKHLLNNIISNICYQKQYDSGSK